MQWFTFTLMPLQTHMFVFFTMEHKLKLLFIEDLIHNHIQIPKYHSRYAITDTKSPLVLV